MTNYEASAAAASDDLTARALAGPHRDWDTFDMSLEGARYHRLQELVSVEDFDEVEAGTLIEELRTFAHVYGYGQADCFFGQYASYENQDFEDDREACIRRDQLMRSYDEDVYFEYVAKSNRLLDQAAATDRAKEVVANLVLVALDAFCAGRDQKIQELELAAAPAP